MEIEYNGELIRVDVIGGFKIEDKEYAVCSYVDTQENYKIAIVQVRRDSEGIHAMDIPSEDIEKVTKYYEEIKNKIMEDGE